MITLRPYQQQYEHEILDFFRAGGMHTIVQAPTGSGKTVMFSSMAQKAAKKGKKILIITDRAELLLQTGGTLSEFHLDPFYIQAGCKYINPNYSVYVAMAITLKNRLKNPIWKKWFQNLDLVIIDELHKQEFNAFFTSELLDNKRVLGFSATPKRGGKQRQLALDYEKIITCTSVEELIEEGYLVRDDYYGVNGVDMNNVKYDPMKGDYSESDMFSRFNTTKLYAGVVKNWLQIAPMSHTLCFCVNIEHVIHTTEEFQNNGIDARFLVSNMSLPKEPTSHATDGAWVRYEERLRLHDLYKRSYGWWSGERSEIIAQHKRREFPVLINASILTTGYDDPNLETGIINRATMSEALWLQMTGRMSRPGDERGPKKTHFNLLDFGENASRLGHYSAPRIWSLWHEAGNKGKGLPPLKECGSDNKGMPINKDVKGCERLIMASFKICPFCGFKYPSKKAKEVDLNGVVYNNVTHTSIKVKKVAHMDDQELYDYFKMKKHKSAWLWRQLWFRGGEDKIREYGLKFNWRAATIEKAVIYTSEL